MDYPNMIDLYIKQSGLTLTQIVEKMEKEKGVMVDRTYLSKLRRNPKYSASETINRTFAEVTGGNVYKLVWAGLTYGVHPYIEGILHLIDDETIETSLAHSLYSQEERKYENHPTLAEIDRTEPAHLFRKIPVFKTKLNGQTMEITNQLEKYTFAEKNLLKEKEGFSIKVQGNSLIENRIMDGDILICSKEKNVLPHEIAVVRIKGEYATLNRIKKQENPYLVIPLNRALEPQVYSSHDVEIIGKVVEIRFSP